MFLWEKKHFIEMFRIKSIPLFHLGSSAFSSLLVKIKFTLTFQPIFILLMCVSMRGSLCACVLYTITPVHVGICMPVCESQTIACILTNPSLRIAWGHYHVR